MRERLVAQPGILDLRVEAGDNESSGVLFVVRHVVAAADKDRAIRNREQLVAAELAISRTSPLKIDNKSFECKYTMLSN